MPDSFEQDAEWEKDLNEIKGFLKDGDTFLYVDKMIELRRRKGDAYASAIEQKALKKSRGAAKKETRIVPITTNANNRQLDIQRKIKNFSIKVEDNTNDLKSIYRQIRQEVLKLVHEKVFEPEKFNGDNLNRLLSQYTELNKEYLAAAPEIVLPEVEIYIQPKQSSETLLDYYARLRISREKKKIPVVPRIANESTFEYYGRLIKQKHAWEVVEPERKKPTVKFEEKSREAEHERNIAAGFDDYKRKVTTEYESRIHAIDEELRKLRAQTIDYGIVEPSDGKITEKSKAGNQLDVFRRNKHWDEDYDNIHSVLYKYNEYDKLTEIYSRLIEGLRKWNNPRCRLNPDIDPTEEELNRKHSSLRKQLKEASDKKSTLVSKLTALNGAEYAQAICEEVSKDLSESFRQDDEWSRYYELFFYLLETEHYNNQYHGRRKRQEEIVRNNELLEELYNSGILTRWKFSIFSQTRFANDIPILRLSERIIKEKGAAFFSALESQVNSDLLEIYSPNESEKRRREKRDAQAWEKRKLESENERKIKADNEARERKKNELEQAKKRAEEVKERKLWSLEQEKVRIKEAKERKIVEYKETQEREKRERIERQVRQKKEMQGIEERMAKDYLDIFSEILEQDLDWSSIESSFFLKYLSLCDVKDEISGDKIRDEISKLKADIISKKGLDYAHIVEKNAKQHANEAYQSMLQQKADEEERQREETIHEKEREREEFADMIGSRIRDGIDIIEQTRQKNLQKERDEFCQQLGRTISAPIVGAMLSMNAANQAQFEQMYSNFENTYRQVSFEVVTAINEQNGQYFEKLGNSLENTLKSCTSANLEGLERAATMICRAVNGPIPPRQSNEGPIEWFIRIYAQQYSIAPIVPKQESEGFGSYIARTIAQQNSVTSILPTSSRETFFDYLARLKVSQTR